MRHSKSEPQLLRKTEVYGGHPQTRVFPDAARHAGKPHYIYQPLRRGNDEIRVLELLPGSWPSTIRVRLHHENFDSARSGIYPRYEALSYVWGDASSPTTIIILHDEQQSTLKVTSNCAEALRNLRRDIATPRRLWVDAICVNQGDLDERARQVSIMAAIYTYADSVTAWVGSSTADSEVALLWFATTATKLGVDATTAWSTALDEQSRFLDYSSEITIDADQTRAIDTFMQREWFSRLWIWQEIKLGRRNAVLRCGSTELSWTKFRVAVRHLQGKSLPILTSQHFLARNSLLRQLVDAPEYDLLVALRYMRVCSCTDQRDRIYAAQALQRRFGSNALVKPDYSMDVAEVYTASALKCFERYGRLDLLQYVVHHSVIPGLPSWVPDWSVVDKSRWAFFGNADAGSKPAYEHVHGALVVYGRPVNEIVGAKAYLISDNRASPIEVMAASICELLGVWDVGTEQDCHITRMSSLLAAVEPREYCVPPRSGHPSGAEVQDCIRQVVDSSPAHMLSAEAELALAYAHQILVGRAMLWCADSTHAIGSAGAIPGDIIAVLLGCDLPVILRPLQHGRYRLIGHAYCADNMAGEAILGSLPVAMEAVRAQDADGGFFNAFRNKNTAEVQWNDPRMPELPMGWETLPQAGGRSPSRYRNSSTGETRGFWEDPRCDLAALKGRGVKIETFTIL